ncbi:MAG TPA: ATP-NAD kinase family protein [Candidatus Binatia bacterium]|nr:ATP-NAD kinase family protein [Candidatus Binatia bacterium]
MANPAEHRRRLGLIVNPLAGIGGRVGLKGSDGTTIVARALALGAVPSAEQRAAQTLAALCDLADAVVLGTYPAEMGARTARACGFEPALLGSIVSGRTTADDTRRAASDLHRWGAELLLFAGGDGTARDVAAATGMALPVIGIPAGVKIHSSVFAVTPRRAAEVVRGFVAGRSRLEEREVLDVDEDLFRSGVVAPRLFGCLPVPCVHDLVQRAKAGSRSDPSTTRGVALGVLEEMERDPEALYILGPGSTVKAVGDQLGLETTLLGVDLVQGGRLLGRDLSEAQLLEAIDRHRARIVVTAIGGQGHVFGRGNQQLSPRLIRQVGRDNILVIATLDKLHALEGPLRVDTGDPDCDQLLEGYVRVITGPRDQVVWRVVA